MARPRQANGWPRGLQSPSVRALALLALGVTGCSTPTLASITPTDELLTLSAIDYAFAQVPSNAQVGSRLGLVNNGAEVHELVLLRSDGTVPPQQFLDLDDAGMKAAATEVGILVAQPGKPAVGAIPITEPGQYFVVCFIPVGTHPDASAQHDHGAASPAPAGRSHASMGMTSEFTVP